MKFATGISALLLIFASSEARVLKGKNKTQKKKKDSSSSKYPVQLGTRPYYIVDSMAPSDLKDQLQECAEKKLSFEKSDWSIGHRGACMQVSGYFSKVILCANPST